MATVVYPNDLRSGMVIEYNGELYEVVDAQHFKIAKTSAYVRVKMKSFKTGRVTEVKMNPDYKITVPYIEKKKVQYLYQNGDEYVFMDLDTYEQIPLHKDALGGKEVYLKDGMELDLVLADGSPLTVELPPTMVFEVVYTEPGVKGDRVATAMKAAKLENGLEVSVPLFVETGDKVIIDTRTGEYVKRA